MCYKSRGRKSSMSALNEHVHVAQPIHTLYTDGSVHVHWMCYLFASRGVSGLGEKNVNVTLCALAH